MRTWIHTKKELGAEFGRWAPRRRPRDPNKASLPSEEDQPVTRWTFYSSPELAWSRWCNDEATREPPAELSTSERVAICNGTDADDGHPLIQGKRQTRESLRRSLKRIRGEWKQRTLKAAAAYLHRNKRKLMPVIPWIVSGAICIGTHFTHTCDESPSIEDYTCWRMARYRCSPYPPIKAPRPFLFYLALIRSQTSRRDRVLRLSMWKI